MSKAILTPRADTSNDDDCRPSAADNGQRSRYRSKCPACRKMIEIGHPIRPFKSNGQRVRWQHENCADIPDVTPTALPDEVAALLAKLERRVDELEQREPTPPVFHVVKPEGEVVEIEGHAHPAFAQVLEIAQAREPVFLPGPSGSGKSHLAGQVAQALGLRFGSISCSAGMSESQLLGRAVPRGANGEFEFCTTQFLTCYEQGGVFLFDEIDAADPNVLLVINSALANGHLSVPARHENPVARKHADFVCIAAANTWGHGSDRQYVGRNQLDEATLDRFRIGVVPVDYSEELERALCPLAELFARLRRYRERVRANRLTRVVSTRFMAKAYKMVAHYGWTLEQVDEKLFAGWRPDEVAKVKS